MIANASRNNNCQAQVQVQVARRSGEGQGSRAEPHGHINLFQLFDIFMNKTYIQGVPKKCCNFSNITTSKFALKLMGTEMFQFDFKAP